MPIIRTEDEIQIQFGTGDIGVGTAQPTLEGAENEVFFWQQDPKPIGVEQDDVIGKTTDQFSQPIRLIFAGVASLDVVIAKLMRIRGSMTEGEGSA